MFVCWGSGRATCNMCDKKISKTKIQVVYRGYRQSCYVHLDCLISNGTELIKRLEKKKFTFSVVETIAHMKEYIDKGGGRDDCTTELGTQVRKDAGPVTPKVPCQNCGTETMEEVNRVHDKTG